MNQAQVLYQYRAIQEKMNMQTNYAHKFNDYQLKVQGNNFVANHQNLNEKQPYDY
jgi:hypothetical protein